MFLGLAGSLAGAAEPPREAKNVLVLLGDDLSLPVVGQFYNALQANLKSPDPSAVNVFVESLDFSRFSAPDYPPQLAQWYRHKYRAVRPDVIISVGIPALTFVLNQREGLWPGVPVLAGAVTSHQLRSLTLPAEVTPVLLNLPYEQTLDVALALFPNTRRVVAVYGSAARDKSDIPHLQWLQSKTQNRLEWSYLSGLSVDEFRRKLAALPPQTIVLWSIMSADATGRSFVPAFESVAAIAPDSAAPVFSVYAPYIGVGVVGGVPMDGAATGRQMAAAARSQMGLPPSATTPLTKEGVAPPKFDWRQLQKWGVPEDRLPPGSQFVFRVPSLFETHRELVIATSIALLILAALVVFLAMERRRLAAAQEKLRTQADELRRLSGALIVVQEEERSRIARELHDDINQRLALMAVETRQLRQQPGAAEIALQLDELAASVTSLSTDVHSLAHGLHPAKLDLLGLLPAVKRHCQEVARHSGIAVDLTAGNLPADLPRDTSLCLYRVVQESLANVVRHSGARRASVDLRTLDDNVAVTIADDGHGFDPGSGGAGPGLGIVSMRERLRLVNGSVSIRLLNGAGTEVKATVPLGAAQA